MSATRIPTGYHSVTPCLIVKGASQAIEFYKRVFGGTVLMRLDGPHGTIMHAEIRIGDSTIMLADEMPEIYRSPAAYGGTPVTLMLYVEDCDATFAAAIAAGAQQIRAVADQFYGDRSGSLVDPFGHMWSIATHVEDVSPAEIERRFAAMMQGDPASDS